MCRHRSFIVIEDSKVFSHKTSDHHTRIRSEHKIPEEGFYCGKSHARIEYFPVESLFDIGSWKHHIDESSTPQWYGSDHKAASLKVLIKDHMKYTVTDSTYIFPGDLDLNELRYLKPGSLVVAEGCIYLNSIIELPPDITIIAKRDGVSMENLRNAYRATIIAPTVRCGRVHGNLTVIDKDFSRRRGQDYYRDSYRADMERDIYNSMIYSPSKVASFIP